MNEQLLFDFLSTNNINYTLFKHQPVFTCHDKPILIESDLETIPGAPTKNLFLKDPKSKTFFLITVTQDKKVDLKALSKKLEASRFSFGKPEELLKYLKLTPGAVTPFGLMFDEQKKVKYILDEDFLKAELVVFHPLRNDMNITLTPHDFLIAMQLLEHTPKSIHMPIQKN